MSLNLLKHPLNNFVTDGQTDGRMDGGTDGRMDGQSDQKVAYRGL